MGLFFGLLLLNKPVQLPEYRPPTGEPIPPGIGREFDAAPEIIRAAIAAHWPRDLWDKAAAIVHCETPSYDLYANNTRGEDSRGIFQINVASGAHPQLARYNLYDPDVNAYWAYQIYQQAGSFRPWFNCATRLGFI